MQNKTRQEWAHVSLTVSHEVEPWVHLFLLTFNIYKHE